MKILITIGTRPEAIKLAPLVHALRDEPGLAVRVLATAQHRAMLDDTLAFFGVAPDLDLDVMRDDQGLAQLTGRVLDGVDGVLESERPDLVIVQGDTTTAFATALACFYKDIAVGHVEAGLRSGGKRAPFPEELNRSLTGWMASLHFAPTERARANLIAEGVASEGIHVTGNTVVDALHSAMQRSLPTRFDALDDPLVFVTVHRRETYLESLDEVCAGIHELASSAAVRIVLPVHPNPRVSGTVRRMLGGHPRIELTEPLGYPDTVAALRACRFVLTDSGGLQEEAPSIGRPVLVLREVTERPEGVEAGCARLVGTKREAIVREARALLEDDALHARMSEPTTCYGDGRACARIVAAVKEWWRQR
jgi:UDP-N-acetylglucosamine 2-epimerase (non-hydrolysing)